MISFKMTKIIPLLTILASWPVISDMKLPPIIGGQCEYKSFNGMAKIVSVTRISTADLGLNSEYEVKFLFLPQEETIEKLPRQDSGPFQLFSDIGTQPTKQFIKNHKIKVGGQVKCIMKVIIRGACTPLLFDFIWADDDENSSG